MSAAFARFSNCVTPKSSQWVLPTPNCTQPKCTLLNCIEAMILSSPADVIQMPWLLAGQTGWPLPSRLIFRGQAGLARKILLSILLRSFMRTALRILFLKLKWGSRWVVDLVLYLFILFKLVLYNLMKGGGKNDFLLFREARLRKKVIRLATLSNILALRR